MGWLNIQLMQSSIVGLNNGEGKHHGYFETKSGTGRGLDIRGKCFDLLNYVPTNAPLRNKYRGLPLKFRGLKKLGKARILMRFSFFR